MRILLACEILSILKRYGQNFLRLLWEMQKTVMLTTMHSESFRQTVHWGHGFLYGE